MSDPRPSERPGFRPLAPDEQIDAAEPRSFGGDPLNDPELLRPDPFGTGPKPPLPPREPAPGSMRAASVGRGDEERAPPPGAMARRGSGVASPPPRRADRPRVPVWTAAAGGLLMALIALYALTADRGGRRAAEPADEATVQIVEAPPAEPDEAAPPAAPVRPTDADAVGRAYDDAGAIYRSEGLPGLVRRSQACDAEIRSAPAYERLDYCLAFDAIGAALQQRLNGGQPNAADSWFGQSQARGVAQVRRAAPDEFDPAARVLDVRRVLGEVGRLRRAAAPPVPTAPPPAAEAAAAPATSPPAARTPAAAERPTPAPAAKTADPPAKTPTPTRPSAPRTETLRAAAPRIEPRAAAPPARAERDFSPSFDCRYARTRSERIVCGDPQLAAADRALHRAYEAAIARGVDRRELREEQDQWLRVRERAAPDPVAIEDAYRRRIRELDARGRPPRRGLDAWF
jgi:uncharacterized protein YecT (DUF1311 family)